VIGILRTTWRFLVVAVLLLAATAPLSAAQSLVDSDIALASPANQIILKYKASADVSGRNAPNQSDRMQALSAVAGIRLTYFRPMSGEAHVLRLPEYLPVADVQRIADRLMALPDVEYAEPDRIMRITLTPNDTQYASQWHYFETYGINAPAAWDITTGSSGLVVAVIDTGIRNHADLSGRTVTGYDFITNVTTANDGNGRDNDASDPGDWITLNQCPGGNPAQNSSWHGTHVAGTIGANSNNSTGVAGINWNSKILPVRVLGKCGGSTSDIVDGMRWAAGLSVSGVPANANPAKVLNLSLGGPSSCTATWQNAINAINAVGATIVVAAGNDNANASGYVPASCNGVITVSATNRTGNKASYSNFGAVVEISAPGGDGGTGSPNAVLSTLNAGTTVPGADSYQFYNGTSMAAPHIAGVVSLMLSVNPTLTPAQVLSILQSTAQDFPGGSTCTTSICGSGIVDAAAAVIQSNTGVLTETVYLPAVLRNYSTSAGGGSIVNGAFESGATGWTQSSTNGFPLITNNFSPTAVTAHGGSWGAWLGGTSNETSYIQQTVTIPSGSSILSYWHWIGSSDTCGFDFAYVRVNGVNVDTLNLCSANNTGGWVRRTVNLGAYIGQSVQLQFRAQTDSSVNSNWFLDDVALGASLLFQGGDTPVLPGNASPEAPRK